MAVELWHVIALGGFAGLVNYLQRFAGDDPPPWKWRAFAVKSCTGAFVAILAFWVTRKQIAEVEHALVFIAFAAYGGPLILDAGASGVSAFMQGWAGRAAKKGD